MPRKTKSFSGVGILTPLTKGVNFNYGYKYKDNKTGTVFRIKPFGYNILSKIRRK